jgi:predicted ATPase/class 3 adenylate cyclase
MRAQPHEPSAVIPSGTITFVFTDIEGSTQRWDRNRAAMEHALRRHDAIVHRSIADHGGHVFKTIGDAFCAAFSRPEEAIAAMLAAQRALGAEDFAAVDGLRVRAAIHTGTADERDSDYFGPTVNRVARLLGLAHGGQVLISGVTAEIVRAALPSQAGLRDLGEHRLKDLSRPEHVYQLTFPDLPVEFPPLRSFDARPNNLPRVMTSFVGRTDEIAELVSLVERHRLVTLVGSGGIGKTRTSLQIAATLLDRFSDGVWFIELASLASGDLIASTIARALGLTLAADGDSLEALVRALAKKRALLLFDNCEHVIEAAAHAISTILRSCAEITVLASSRQGIGVEGEATYRMPSLPVPAKSDSTALTPESAMRYAGIALFAERARASDHRFELTNENAPIVADICRRLDGIALAIELAAARVKILSPRQLRDRLDERFRILTGGSRDVFPRQQTLRALIDWSHDLLAERERTLFRRLGVFIDGFTLEGASAVASGDDLDDFEAFDLLASLVEKSLVLAEPNGDALRYRLLESTRAYASEKLRDAGELDMLAARHLRYLGSLFSAIRERLEKTARQAERYEIFATELDDVRFALDGALARSDLVAGAELLAALGLAWRNGFDREGVARLEAYIAALHAGDAILLARLSTTLAGLLLAQGKYVRALEVASEARAYARTSGDSGVLVSALSQYSAANARLGNFADADAALIEASAMPIINANLRLHLIDMRLMLSFFIGDLDAAARSCEELISHNRSLGNVRHVHSSLGDLAEVEHQRGRTGRAITIIREALAEAGDGADTNIHAMWLANLTGYLVASNDFAGAIEAARETIALLAPVPDHYIVTIVLEHLALVDALQSDVARSARLAAYTEAAFARTGTKRGFNEQTTYDRLTTYLNANLAPSERALPARQGAALTPEAAVVLALTIETA